MCALLWDADLNLTKIKIKKYCVLLTPFHLNIKKIKEAITVLFLLSNTACTFITFLFRRIKFCKLFWESENINSLNNLLLLGHMSFKKKFDSGKSLRSSFNPSSPRRNGEDRGECVSLKWNALLLLGGGLGFMWLATHGEITLQWTPLCEVTCTETCEVKSLSLQGRAQREAAQMRLTNCSLSPRVTEH